jgi:hypothetical protein
VPSKLEGREPPELREDGSRDSGPDILKGLRDSTESERDVVVVRIEANGCSLESSSDWGKW